MPSTLVLSLLGFLAVYVSLWLVILLTHDEKEPPLAEDKFPFLGPLIKLIKGGPRFYVQQRVNNNRDKYNLPIYTLRAPFRRIYIVNATELIPALQKQWRHVTLAPIFAGTGKVVSMSQEACEHMHEHLTDETKNFNNVWMSLVTPHISPGSSGLDGMNRRAIGVIIQQIEGLVRELEFNRGKTIGIQEWLYRVMLLASTDAVYGPLNPFRDSRVEKAWDTFEMDFLTLVLMPIPDIISGYFTRKVVSAREIIIDAFEDFLRKGGTRSASALLQLKHAHHLEKFNDRDVAATDLALSYAILGNTRAAAWWLIYHIFSNQQVLDDLRHELSSVPGLVIYTTVEDSNSNLNGEEVTASIDLSNIRTQCPILLSTVQEMLRYRSVANSVRKVIEQDVMLDGQFLLKKGSYLMLPHVVQHTSVRAFGSNVNEFDHTRFVRRSTTTRNGKQENKGAGGGAVPGLDRRAFYAFGGGKDMCPGRHFASMQLMALAVLMVLRFDIEPVTEDGKWTEPTWDNSPLAAGVPYPDEEVYVRIKVRDRMEDGGGDKRKIAKWNVGYSDWARETPLDMLAEDGQQ